MSNFPDDMTPAEFELLSEIAAAPPTGLPVKNHEAAARLERLGAITRREGLMRLTTEGAIDVHVVRARAALTDAKVTLQKAASAFTSLETTRNTDALYAAARAFVRAEQNANNARFLATTSTQRHQTERVLAGLTEAERKIVMGRLESR